RRPHPLAEREVRAFELSPRNPQLGPHTRRAGRISGRAEAYPENRGRWNGGASVASGKWSRSAAGDAHVTRECRRPVAPVDDEVVPLGLPPNRLVDCGLQKGVIGGGSQRGPQVGGVFLAKAHVERTGAGKSDPVAGLTEVVGKRGD